RTVASRVGACRVVVDKPHAATGGVAAGAGRTQIPAEAADELSTTRARTGNRCRCRRRSGRRRAARRGRGARRRGGGRPGHALVVHALVARAAVATLDVRAASVVDESALRSQFRAILRAAADPELVARLQPNTEVATAAF